MSDEKKSATLVMGVIGEDVHVVGIRILEYALTDAGFKVVSLGSQVSQEEFIEAAIETKAAAILVSSFSGHAESLTTGFKEKCKEAGLDNVLLLIGGYLLLEQKPWAEIENKYRQMGFSGVYPPGTTPTRVVEDLQNTYFGLKEAAG